MTKVEGELSIDTGRHRSLAYVPETCADGGHFGFFGVQLRDGEDRFLELFRNGRDPGLAFYVVGGVDFELGPDDCRVLEASLVRRHNRTTDTGKIDGSLEIDCEVPNGWTLQGSLSFERCAEPMSEDDEYDEYDDEDDEDDDVWFNDGL